MADLVVVIGVLAFFAISALLVIGCDRIIGPDTDALTTEPADAAREEVAAMVDAAR